MPTLLPFSLVLLPRLLGLLLVCVCWLGLTATSQATELPNGVLHYLKQADATVDVRFDGVVTLSDGNVYIPVFPQRPANAAGAAPLAGTPKLSIHKAAPGTPSTSEPPDLIPFSEGFYLIRVIRTTSGKLALAKVDPYPIGLKEGLLPQDMLLPSALYIPAELKVILGNLPYKPMHEPVIGANGGTLPAANVFKPSTQTDTTAGSNTRPAAALPANSVYYTRVDTQELLRGQLAQPSVEAPVTLKQDQRIKLGCLPLSLHASQDKTHLFIPCLNKNEVVIVDTETQSVQTRLAVSSPIANSVAMSNDTLILTHRTTNDITRLHMGKRQMLASIDPGIRGYALAYNNHFLYIADVSQPTIVVWDIKTNTQKTTLPGLQDTSALAIHDVNSTPVLWAASRNLNQVAAINIASGKLLRQLNVGKKPVGIAVHPKQPNRVWVISGGDHQLNLINDKGEVAVWATLPKGSFPTRVTFLNEGRQLLITAAGGRSAYLANANSATPAVTQAIPLPGKSNAILVATPDNTQLSK